MVAISPIERLAAEPGGAAFVEVVHLGALQAWHVGLDVVSDPGLQVGEVTVALREAGEQLSVEPGFAKSVVRPCPRRTSKAASRTVGGTMATLLQQDGPG